MMLEPQYENIVETAIKLEEEKARIRDHELVPEMEDIMYNRDLKVVVKMTNHVYTSVNDIFEKSGPGRFISEAERKLLEKEQKKREALKMKLPKRIAPRELILGF
jgi:hypothetical protein